MRKLDVLRTAPEPRRPTHNEDLDKVASAIEADQRHIGQSFRYASSGTSVLMKDTDLLLRRRVFIRFCMWQEVILMFRSTSLLSTTIKEYVADEIAYGERLKANWELLSLSLGT